MSTRENVFPAELPVVVGAFHVDRSLLFIEALSNVLVIKI